MSILLDQNLSPKLVRRLADLLPRLTSVYDHDLIGAADHTIFEWAKRRELIAIISSDQDFVRLVQRFGPPPKVIWIERCDFPSKVIEELIRRESLRILDFLASDRFLLSLKLEQA